MAKVDSIASTIETNADAHVALTEIAAIAELLFACGTSDHEVSRDALLAVGGLIRRNAAEIEPLLIGR